MLRPQPIGPVPEETARVASAAFPKGHPYLCLADELGTLFADELFAPLFPAYDTAGEIAGALNERRKWARRMPNLACILRRF